MSLGPTPLPARARIYIGLTTLFGIVVLSLAAFKWESPDLLKYGGFLMVAIFSCGMRISVPGITGTLSLTFLFVLFGVVELTGPETVVLGSLVTLLQCYWNQPQRTRLAQVLFNVSSMAVAVAVTEQSYQASWFAAHNVDPSIRLAVATCVLFLMNTTPVAVVIALAEERAIFPCGASAISGHCPTIWVVQPWRRSPVSYPTASSDGRQYSSRDRSSI